jgi:ADP-ribosylglycohydrolase
MHRTRLQRARASLEGLATGDAFGEQFFQSDETVRRLIAGRALPPAPWTWTDDTAMATSIVDELAECQEIVPSRLATRFAQRYRLEPARGYGRGMHEYFDRVAAGVAWHAAAAAAFDGRGSMGNGAAMRVAPVGAYFCDELTVVVEQAGRSAAVTHAHAEATAGAIAVAVSAACVARGERDALALFASALAFTPPGETRARIEAAASLPLGTDPVTAANMLGNGSRALAQDTVPFSLWCAARHLGDYENALWSTVAGLGDRDTTCAIVGGIVASDPDVDPPPDWLAAREPLDYPLDTNR